MKTLLNIILIFFFSLSSYGQKDTSVVRKSLFKDSLNSKELDLKAQKILSSLKSSIVDTAEFSSMFLEKEEQKENFLEKIRSTKLDGLVSVGHDYGLVTGYIDTIDSRNLAVFRTNGDLSISSFGVPINFSYNYSTLRNPLGANNYFRFSLDTDKLEQQGAEKKLEKLGDIDTIISDVKKKKGELNGKLGYGEVVIQMLKRQLEAERIKLESEKKKIDKFKLESDKYETSLNDSLDSFSNKRMNQKPGIDSLQKSYDKLNYKYQQSMMLCDSVNKIYTKAKTVYKKYEDYENQLNAKKDQLNNVVNATSKDALTNAANDSLNQRKDSFLSSIKTLDIGLTYPQTSGLTKNSPPIKGINVEIQRKNWYYSLAAGITLNNIMVSTDVIDNKLNYSENLFNQFDFQRIQKNGFLVAAKSGYGTTEGTHAFIGMRYLTNSRFDASAIELTDSLLVPSIGLELDFRWKPKFSKNTVVDLVYGKTSSSQKVINKSRESAIHSLFSKDRTNTGLFSVKQSFPRLKSDATTSIRVLDPLADMRSLGVLQPNNIRYELRTNHRITSQLNLGFSYRFDRNNIDNRLDTTAGVNVFGLQAGGSIGSKFTYSGNVNYLNQKIDRHSNGTQFIRNYILGLSATYKYSIDEIENAATFNYNDFLITDEFSTGNYRTFGLQNATLFENSSNLFSITYFSMSSLDSISTSALIIGNDYTISNKRMKITGGIKISISNEFGNSVGGKIECLSKITNYMDLLIRAEKFVLGNFYNSYDRSRFNNFPYLVTAQLNFKIK